MLVAYFDDSGTHDESKNCIIGGYRGSVNEWKRFDRAWKPILKAFDVEEFHAKEFWPRPQGKRIGIYRDWSDEKHRDFIDQLLKVIESSKIFPIACGVLRGEWDKLSADKMALYSGTSRLHKPQFLALQRVVVSSAEFCHNGRVMHFVFDESPHSSVMLECFHELKQGFRETGELLLDHIGEFSTAESRIATPLQAADLLAYEAHRWAKKGEADRNYSMRDVYQRAMKRMKSKEDFRLFDENRFSMLERAANLAANQS